MKLVVRLDPPNDAGPFVNNFCNHTNPLDNVGVSVFVAPRREVLLPGRVVGVVVLRVGRGVARASPKTHVLKSALNVGRTLAFPYQVGEPSTIAVGLAGACLLR